MAPHCLRPHRSVSERVAFWLKPCMDNGLGRHHTDIGTAAQGTSRGGVGSLIQGHAMTLPTGCIWIEEHLERRPPSTHTHTHTHTHTPSTTHVSLEQRPGLVWWGRLPRQMVRWVDAGWAWDVHGQWCGWWKRTDMLWLALGTLVVFT